MMQVDTGPLTLMRSTLDSDYFGSVGVGRAEKVEAGGGIWENPRGHPLCPFVLCGQISPMKFAECGFEEKKKERKIVFL